MLDVAIRFLAHILTPLFIIGMLGSTVVVVITLVHDVHDFLSDN